MSNGQALFTACKLKVFDLLKDEAPLGALDVAVKTNTSVCGIGRLLDVCAALGLLQKTERGKGSSSKVLCPNLGRWKEASRRVKVTSEPRQGGPDHPSRCLRTAFPQKVRCRGGRERGNTGSCVHVLQEREQLSYGLWW